MNEPNICPPSADEIRDLLLRRARSFIFRHRTSFSAIGIAAVNDSKFLRRVELGEGFNITTYQRVLEWMNATDTENSSLVADDLEDAAPATSCHVNATPSDLPAEGAPQ